MEKNHLAKVLGIALLGSVLFPSFAQAHIPPEVLAKITEELSITGDVNGALRNSRVQQILRTTQGETAAQLSKMNILGKIDNLVKESTVGTSLGSVQKVPLGEMKQIKSVIPEKDFVIDNSYLSQPEKNIIMGPSLSPKASFEEKVEALLNTTSLCRETREQILRQAKEAKATVDEVKEMIGDAQMDFVSASMEIYNGYGMGENMVTEMERAVEKFHLSINELEALAREIKARYLSPSEVLERTAEMLEEYRLAKETLVREANEALGRKANEDLAREANEAKVPANTAPKVPETSEIKITPQIILSPAQRATEFSLFEGYYDGRTLTALEVEQIKQDSASVFIDKFGQVEIFKRDDLGKIVAIDNEFHTIAFYLPQHYLVTYKPKVSAQSALDSLEFPAIWDSVGTDAAFRDVVEDRHLSLRQTKELARAVKGKKFTYQTLTDWLDAHKDFLPASFSTGMLSIKRTYMIAKNAGLSEEITQAFSLAARSHYLSWVQAEELAQAIQENNLAAEYIDDLTSIMFAK